MMGKKTNELISEIINHFVLKDNPKNRDYINTKFYKYNLGRKPIKIVSFDSNGLQKKVFMSIVECADVEGVKYKSMHQAIIKGSIVRKTGLRYCKLKDFGNYKNCI